jgi:hypothetical protein
VDLRLQPSRREGRWRLQRIVVYNRLGKGGARPSVQEKLLGDVDHLRDLFGQAAVSRILTGTQVIREMPPASTADELGLEIT